MKMVVSSCLCAFLLAGAAPSVARAEAQSRPRSDQDAALKARMQGQTLPFREIERRVLPTMRGSQFLGFDFDSRDAIYTLKFMSDGDVVWVHVDGRTGRIIGRSGK